MIQRQYNLPNCTLILEGFSRSAGNTRNNDQTPPPSPSSLDILTRFECHLSGEKQPLIGGRDLLKNLAIAVSQCTQEWLSGVRRYHRGTANPVVDYQSLEPNLFRLTVPSALLFDGSSATDKDQTANSQDKPVELTLSTMQLFDLVEALDQLLTDSQTLADLSLELQSLPRRGAEAARPMAERAAPAVLGISSLVVAAAALFFVPVPEVRRPTRPVTPTESNPAGTEPQSTDSAPPNPASQP